MEILVTVTICPHISVAERNRSWFLHSVTAPWKWDGISKELCSKQGQGSRLLPSCDTMLFKIFWPSGTPCEGRRKLHRLSWEFQVKTFPAASIGQNQTKWPQFSCQGYVVSIWAKGNQGSGTLSRSLPHRPQWSPEFHVLLPPRLVWVHACGWDVTLAVCSSPFSQSAFSYFYKRKMDLSLIIHLTIHHSQDCKDLQAPNKVTICNIGVGKSPLINVPLTLRRVSSFCLVYQGSCYDSHGVRTAVYWPKLGWSESRHIREQSCKKDVNFHLIALPLPSSTCGHIERPLEGGACRNSLKHIFMKYRRQEHLFPSGDKQYGDVPDTISSPAACHSLFLLNYTL